MAPPYDDQQTIYNPFNPHYSGYQPPLAFMQSAMPMYGSGGPPLMTGPFNMPGGFGGGGGGGMGMMLNAMMPVLMSKFAGNGRVPAQFFPQQGYYDQLQAQEFYNSNQQAMQLAAGSDIAAINRTIGGFQQMMTGKPLTEADRARNFGLATTTSQMMPILTQMLGPDLIDSLHGSRGSATVFANQLHTALRTSRDPITGAIGMSGESAGRVSQGVYENLFSADNYNPATLKGMSAGQAGMLAKELQTRGLLGIPLGSRDMRARMAAIPTDVSDATLRRIALNTQEMRDISMNDPNGPTEAQLNAATARVRDTYSKMRDPATAPATADELAAMPGGEDLLRTADASRITNRLQNLSGAVKAMREIFGDMGNPNAPMREIVDGLNRLTQGGLSTMAPSTLEAAVRKTQAISKQTGMSIEGIMALTDTAAQMGDALGLNRGSAVINAQQSALFGAVAMDTMNLDSRAYGQGTVERVTMSDLQLRTAATASVAAQQMNTALRMVEEGVITPKAGSELEKYIAAAKAGDKQYDFRRSYAAFNDMMIESGANVGQVNTYRKNSTYNQRYGEQYDTGGTVRAGSMTRDAINQSYAPGVQQSLNSAAGDIDAVANLQASGVTTNANDLQQMTRSIGNDVTNAFFRDMSSETVNDDKLRMAAFEKASRTSIEKNIRARMPGATPAAITAATDKYIADRGGIRAIAGSAFAALDAAGAGDKQAGSAIMAHNVYGTQSVAELDRRTKQATIDGIRGSTFAGLGTSNPMQRLMDVAQGTGPEGITPDKLGELLGGISKADINAADPTGILAQSLGLWNENKKLDVVKDYDQVKFNAEAMRALWAGGADAKAFYNTYNNDPRLTGNAKLLSLVEAARKDNYKGVEDLKRAIPSLVGDIDTADLAAEDKQKIAQEGLLTITPKPVLQMLTAVAGTTTKQGEVSSQGVGYMRRKIDESKASMSRAWILNLGLKKGVFGKDKTTIADLDPEDYEKSNDLVEKADLTDAERKKFEAIRPATQLYDKVYKRTAEERAIQQTDKDTTQAVRPDAQAATTTATTPDGDKKMTVVMSGKFEEINGEGRTFAITGQGDAAARSFITSAVT